MGTSFLRDSGQEERVCPLLFISYVLLSWLFGGQNRCVSPWAEAGEGADSMPCRPPPFNPVQLQLWGTAPGRSPRGPGGCFSLLPPLAVPLLLAAGLRVLSRRGQGSRRAPIAGGLAPSPATNARRDVQGCPADPGPGACLLCRQGLISLAAAAKRVNTLRGISSALHRLFCLLLN